MTVTEKKKSRRKRRPEKSMDQFVLVYQNPRENRVKPKTPRTLKPKADPVYFVMNHDHSFDGEDDTI